jgi:hypothetical protein
MQRKLKLPSSRVCENSEPRHVHLLGNIVLARISKQIDITLQWYEEWPVIGKLYTKKITADPKR